MIVVAKIRNAIRGLTGKNLVMQIMEDILLMKRSFMNPCIMPVNPLWSEALWEAEQEALQNQLPGGGNDNEDGANVANGAPANQAEAQVPPDAEQTQNILDAACSYSEDGDLMNADLGEVKDEDIDTIYQHVLEMRAEFLAAGQFSSDEER